MLGSGIMLIGLFLALSASVSAFRTARDRSFAIAALAVVGTELLALLVVAVLSALAQRGM